MTGTREHDWATCFAEMPGASVPLAGFGSSDCACETHLYFFKKRPARAAVEGVSALGKLQIAK
jgi:Uri superfamily endonuclease